MALEIPSCSHISETVSTPSLKYCSQSTAFCWFFLLIPLGAPNILPRLFADSRIAFVRSIMMSLSNWARAANMFTMNLEWEDVSVVSRKGSVILLNFTPFLFNWFIKLEKCIRLLAKRSFKYTYGVPTTRIKENTNKRPFL